MDFFCWSSCGLRCLLLLFSPLKESTLKVLVKKTIEFHTCDSFFILFFFVPVQALIGIKASLKDPHGVLQNWDKDSVDPCSWTMVTCSSDNLVIGLYVLLKLEIFFHLFFFFLNFVRISYFSFDNIFTEELQVRTSLVHSLQA